MADYIFISLYQWVYDLHARSYIAMYVSRTVKGIERLKRKIDINSLQKLERLLYNIIKK